MSRRSIAALLAVLCLPSVATATERPSPGAVTATTVTLPRSPGSVQGLGDEIEIGIATAQVTYGVPFDLPSSSGGFGPSLSLSYSGDLGNGVAGVGWSIATPFIARSTRHGVPGYDDNDEIEIFGPGSGRLIDIGDGTYRVEGAGNAIKAVREGNRWIVTDSDGTTYFYGLFPESRQESANGTEVRTSRWYVDLVLHRSGQTIRYDYTPAGNTVYLAEIKWGPGERFVLQLDYEVRPDPTISYRTGFRVDVDQRLTAVRLLSSGTELREYHLAYDDTFTLSRLAQVHMTGLAGNGATEPVSFTYMEPSLPSVTPLPGTDGWRLEERGVAFFDVDGDGMDDLLRLEMGNHQYRKNLGDGFTEARRLDGATAISLDTAQMLDLDGDARPELVRVVDDTWRAYRLDPVAEQWQPLGEWPGSRGLPLAVHGGTLVDINGDGSTDVVQGTASGILISMGGPTGMSPSFLAPRISASDATVEPGEPDVSFTDVNGDGIVDVVWLTDAWMKYFLGRGDGTFVPWRRVFYPWGQAAFDPRDVSLADLDRDGIVDLVRYTLGHVSFYQGQADGSFVAAGAVRRPEAADADVVTSLADANGNGSTDIVWSSPRGMWVLDLAGPGTAGMMHAIDNGLGKTTTFHYEASAALSVEAELSGAVWSHKLPASIPVPVQVDVDTGEGPLRITHYGVRDGLWDGVERRFGGFLETRQSLSGDTAADVVVTTTRYRAGLGSERVLRGKPWWTRAENGLGVVHTISRTEWATHPIDDLPTAPLLRVPVAWEVRTSHYEGVPEALETLTYHIYDGQGRAVESWDLGRLDLSGDETVVKRSYASNTDAWIRDRVCQEDVYEGDGTTLVSATRTLYGGPTGTALPLCEIGDGLVRKTQGWLDEELRWVTISRTDEYSPGWNPLSAYSDGVARTYTYQDDLYPATESVSPDGVATLTWTAAWDTVRGLPTTSIAPDGVMTTAGYDDLGRLESLAVGSQPPHMRVAYDWTAPRPTTTSWTFDGPEANLTDWTTEPAVGSGWRKSVAVANGAGETLYTATRLAADVAGDEWIISGWHDRDARGRAVAGYDDFTWIGVDPSAVTAAPAPPINEAEYDAFDRVTLQTQATGATRQTTYWAFGTQAEVSDLAPVTSFLDGQGRITRTERLVNSIVESGTATYDAAGQLRTLTLQKGQANEVVHSFTYDTLGRLTFATDPDSGDRDMLYDDAGRLLESTNAAGQTIEYDYDGAGRLTSMLADDGTEFTYHYDTALEPATFEHTAGRLAWVEEPTGQVELGYDAHGRAVALRRDIDGVEAEQRTTYAPSGVVLEVDFLDGLVIDMTYDPAGRTETVGSLWEVLERDDAGRLLRERYGNGVEQIYQRDVLGRPDDIRIERPTGAALYDVSLTRTPFGAIDSVADSDGVGLDHTASFTFDPAGRLTDATIGAAGPSAYAFHYQYDGLQNMVERTVSGPTSLGVLAGSYEYAGPDGSGGTYSERQLSRIDDGTGGTVSTFDYDPAGRLITQDGLSLTYNGLDQLTQVGGLGGGTDTVQYAYGYDGLRVKTIHPDGTVERWFTEGISEKDGLREHYVRLGDRLIARVTQEWDAGGGMAAPPPPDWKSRPLAPGLAPALLVVLALVLVGSILGRYRRRYRCAVSTPRRALTAMLLATVFLAGCALFGSKEQSLWTHYKTVYYHTTVGAGPSLVTRDGGEVETERRYEPFGERIDAYREDPAGGSSIGAIDYELVAENILNKQSDPSTGWSYHGARWMAPPSGRWLTPDPLSALPRNKYVARPWTIHPYQYVEQNPIVFWDPTGLDSDWWDDIKTRAGGALKAAAGGGGAWAASKLCVNPLGCGVALAGMLIFADVTAEGTTEFFTGNDAKTFFGAAGDALGLDGRTIEQAQYALLGATGAADIYAAVHLYRAGLSAPSTIWGTGWLREGLLSRFTRSNAGVAPKTGATLFANQLGGRLSDELADAARVGASPVRPGDPGFEAALNSGTIKFVVTESGDLVVVPHTVSGVEVSHAVLSGGGAVRAAGHAEVAAAEGQIFGISMNARSGHYGETSREAAEEAFARFGISFPD